MVDVDTSIYDEDGELIKYHVDVNNDGARRISSTI